MLTPTLHTRSTAVRGRTLSAEECRNWLESHRCGRLGFMSGRGPRSVAVCYAVRSDTVVLRVGEYNDIAHYAPDAQVTLEVDGFAPDSNGVTEFETVTLAGRATRAGPDDAPDGCEVWPDGVATTVISIPLESLDGTAEQFPPAAASLRPSRSTTALRAVHDGARAESGRSRESCRVRI